MAEKVLEESEDIKERATKEAEGNKKFNWSTLVGFGTGALATIGVVVFSKETPDMLKKLMEKK